MEAYVHVDEGNAWFIQGRSNMNRAVNGDTVAVELLPESEWTCPQKVIRVSIVNNSFVSFFFFFFGNFLLSIRAFIET